MTTVGLQCLLLPNGPWRQQNLHHHANYKRIIAATARSWKSCFSTARMPEHVEGARMDQGTFSSEANKTKYPHLFAPLDLGPDIGWLPNRALMGSMHSGLEGLSMPSWMVPWITGHKDSHSTSLDRMATYFEARALGGVGLMVTGGIAPNMEGWTGPFSSQLVNTDEMARHKVVTQTVHAVQVPMGAGDQGQSVPARICLQILHTGRYAYHPLAVSASATRSPISPFSARALDASGIRRTIRDFVRTAELAAQAGYDGVEIMGSEGYLLSQFLSPHTNHRKDEYGGEALENRARLALEIIRQTRQAVGPQFIIIFRISLLDLVEGGLQFNEAVQFARMVQDAGATILNTGIGWHEARVPTIATCVPRGAFTFPTRRLKELAAVDIPLVATNRINHPQTAEKLLEQNSADMISMARPFLADPELILKSRTGRENEINTCIGCNQACLDHVFVGKVASCLVNPAACHETEIRPNLLPTEDRLTLGVVGAGPAGCAFAITARKMGHRVILFDGGDQIGGQFNMAKRIPGKEEFHETIRYFTTQLQKLGVEVRLNSKLSARDMENMTDKIDKWIDATGVEPRNPKIPGQEHPHVLSYIDVLKHRKSVGEKVAIIGAGGIGFDVAEYLVHWDGVDRIADEVDAKAFYQAWGIDENLERRGGLAPHTMHHKESQSNAKRKLYLMQRKSSKVGQGLGKTTGWIHRTSLKHSGAVEMIAGAKYSKIDQNGHLHLELSDGSSRVLEVDNIVLCAGQIEHTGLRDEALPDLKRRIFAIGGAFRAGELDAKRAIDMGTRLALKIHKPDLVAGHHIIESSSTPGLEEKLYSYLQKLK